MRNTQEVMDLYLKMGTLQATADEIGITRERVRQIVCEDPLYVASVNRRAISLRSAEAKRLHDAGMTMNEIAEAMGVTRTSASRYLKHAGVEHGNKRRTPIGCDLCGSVPYSRGLCRRCYSNWVRYGRSEETLEKAHRKIDAIRGKTS